MIMIEQKICGFCEKPSNADVCDACNEKIYDQSMQNDIGRERPKSQLDLFIEREQL